MRCALSRGIIEVPSSADAHAALDNLDVRLLRLQSLRSPVGTAQFVVDDGALAHFVNYGAALLNAPDSAAQSELDGIPLDYWMLRLATNGLCRWLQLLKLLPRQIFVLEDENSQIIGRVVALQLGVGFEIMNGNNYMHSKSLIVGADGRDFTSPALRMVFPGQVLYAFNLHQATGSIVPDAASFIQPKLILPWQNQRLSPSRIASTAERIFNTPLCAPANNWPERLEFYRARREQLIAGNSVFRRSTLLLAERPGLE